MANKTDTRADLVDDLKKEVGLSHADSVLILEEVLGEVTACLANDEALKITGFGTFLPHHKKQRMGRNPKTGEEAVILPRKVVKFRPSENLKRKVRREVK